jgi:hypothetical protein
MIDVDAMRRNAAALKDARTEQISSGSHVVLISVACAVGEAAPADINGGDAVKRVMGEVADSAAAAAVRVLFRSLPCLFCSSRILIDFSLSFSY